MDEYEADQAAWEAAEAEAEREDEAEGGDESALPSTTPSTGPQSPSSAVDLSPFSVEPTDTPPLTTLPIGGDGSPFSTLTENLVPSSAHRLGYGFGISGALGGCILMLLA